MSTTIAEVINYLNEMQKLIVEDAKHILPLEAASAKCGVPLLLMLFPAIDFMAYLTYGDKTAINKNHGKRVMKFLEDPVLCPRRINDSAELIHHVFRNGSVHSFFPKMGAICRSGPFTDLFYTVSDGTNDYPVIIPDQLYEDLQKMFSSYVAWLAALPPVDAQQVIDRYDALHIDNMKTMKGILTKMKLAPLPSAVSTKVPGVTATHDMKKIVTLPPGVT